MEFIQNRLASRHLEEMRKEISATKQIRRTCGRHGARSHPAPPNQLDISTGEEICRAIRLILALARKGEGNVWRKPNSS